MASLHAFVYFVASSIPTAMKRNVRIFLKLKAYICTKRYFLHNLDNPFGFSWGVLNRTTCGIFYTYPRYSVI